MWLLYTVAAFSIVTFACAAQARSTKHRRPKGYQQYRPELQLPYKRVTDNTRDNFKARKLPDEIDFVVVGSGMGSLYCSALLAKAGYKVVILEQHYVAGGCTHAFEDKGYEFDTGLHYVGCIHPTAALRCF